MVLGADKKLDVSAGRTLPFTLGHEIAGVVGRRVAVYPWIGCGTCAACRVGEENLCGNNRYLGVAVDGGFATHVLVPHRRYLLDYAPLPANFAGPLMCSGLTAYAAQTELAPMLDAPPRQRTPASAKPAGV